MNKEILKDLTNFCKSNRLTDKTFKELYQAFHHKGGNELYSKEDFEIGMLDLRKTRALFLKEKCLLYVKMYGVDAFDTYIKDTNDIEDIEPVTEEFWEYATGQTIKPKKKVLSENAYSKLLPASWATMSSNDRIDFVKKIQHQGFKDYVLSLDKRVRDFVLSTKKDESKNMMKIYTTLFSFNPKKYDKKTKDLFRSFVDSINNLGRGNLQYVECKEPHVIEIREIR